jgi:hypothetical protein
MPRDAVRCSYRSHPRAATDAAHQARTAAARPVQPDAGDWDRQATEECSSAPHPLTRRWMAPPSSVHLTVPLAHSADVVERSADAARQVAR